MIIELPEEIKSAITDLKDATSEYALRGTFETWVHDSVVEDYEASSVKLEKAILNSLNKTSELSLSVSGRPFHEMTVREHFTLEIVKQLIAHDTITNKNNDMYNVLSIIAVRMSNTIFNNLYGDNVKIK